MKGKWYERAKEVGADQAMDEALDEITGAKNEDLRAARKAIHAMSMIQTVYKGGSSRIETLVEIARRLNDVGQTIVEPTAEELTALFEANRQITDAEFEDPSITDYDLAMTCIALSPSINGPYEKSLIRMFKAARSRKAGRGDTLEA